MRRAQQERIKLFAAYLNTIAAGMIVTGIVAPSAALVLNPALSTSSFVMPGLTITMAAVGYLIIRVTSR